MTFSASATTLAATRATVLSSDADPSSFTAANEEADAMFTRG
jgi:hypothetical protein